MVKKKSNPSSDALSMPPMPGDRRAMEKMMADLQRILNEQNFGSIDEANQFLETMFAETGGRVPERASQSALEQAQDVMYQAWEARSRGQAVKLARKALQISPDCADAYVLLAEVTARTPQEARKLYEQGVAAGERALGPEAFKEMEGHFWGVLETRPYMRARFGLAEALWALGEHRAAADHMQEMLRLNPNDNLGVRYSLCTLLLIMGDDAALEKLFKQYKDDWSANWKYNRALLAFRKDGKGKKADKLLREAFDNNRFVPPYLLGQKKLPRRMPAYYSPGDENEAIEYILDALDLWKKTPGALDWLAAVLSERPA